MNIFWLLIYIAFSGLFLLFYKQEKADNNIRKAIKKNIINNRELLNDIFAACIMVSFSFLCATRRYDTYDTIVYQKWYLNIIKYPLWHIQGEYGLMFEVLSKIISIFCGGNFRLYLFILPLINNIIVYQVLKKAEGIGGVGYLIYSFTANFYYNFAVLRQGLAITFVIWAFASWKNKKKLIILLIMATLSHNTAIVVLIFVLVIHVFQLQKKALILLWSASLINYLFPLTDKILDHIIDFLGAIIPASMKGRYILYFVEGINNRTISLYYLVYFLLIFFLINSMYINKPNIILTKIFKNTEDIKNKRFLNIGVVGLVLLSIGSSFTVIVRLSDYFIMPCLIFLIPGYAWKQTIKGKGLVFAMCSLALLLYIRMFLVQTQLYI